MDREKVLNFVREWYRSHGRTPSIEQIVTGTPTHRKLLYREFPGKKREIEEQALGLKPEQKEGRQLKGIANLPEENFDQLTLRRNLEAEAEALKNELLAKTAHLADHPRWSAQRSKIVTLYNDFTRRFATSTITDGEHMLFLLRTEQRKLLEEVIPAEAIRFTAKLENVDENSATDILETTRQTRPASYRRILEVSEEGVQGLEVVEEYDKSHPGWDKS